MKVDFYFDRLMYHEISVLSSLQIKFQVYLREIQIPFTHEIPVRFTNEILKLLGCISIGVNVVALPSNNKQTCFSIILYQQSTI